MKWSSITRTSTDTEAVSTLIMTQSLSQYAAHAGCGILLHGGFVPDFRRSLDYVCEFLCHRKNEVGYMAKVETRRGGRKDTPPADKSEFRGTRKTVVRLLVCAV